MLAAFIRPVKLSKLFLRFTTKTVSVLRRRELWGVFLSLRFEALKHDVNGRQQTAKITVDLIEFFSSNP